jgi:ABC-2 type transport system ATP-binding protein
MTSVLEVNGARKAFGETIALDGAELTLRRGEWLALLGPNGAGKTTLIRAVAGRVHLDRGAMRLLDHDLNGDAAIARAARDRLGIVPQSIALYPLLTARENLRIFGSFHGVRGEALAERITWALEWTGLAERADDRVQTYSGGMQRRLNIACGVLHQPDILLLDEPTVGVDPQSRQRIWEMLDQIRQAGASLLLTTHQLDEAQVICDRIVIIDHGRSIADGTLDELVAKTIGRGRRVTLTLDRPLAPGSLDGLEIDGCAARCTIVDATAELPALLSRVAKTGASVADVRMDAPSLHAVFLHLTGRELRE